MDLTHYDDRLEVIRSIVDNILRAQADLVESRCGFVHLYGVSATCVLLAERRGVNAELSAVAGMLHDIAAYETGDTHDHARRGAERARELLSELGRFSVEEVAAITEAIANHSDKERIDSSLSEILKDADVLQHYLYNPWLEHDSTTPARMKRLCTVLGFFPVIAVNAQ